MSSISKGTAMLLMCSSSGLQAAAPGSAQHGLKWSYAGGPAAAVAGIVAGCPLGCCSACPAPACCGGFARLPTKEAKVTLGLPCHRQRTGVRYRHFIHAKMYKDLGADLLCADHCARSIQNSSVASPSRDEERRQE
jgi:hypothetical protein